MTVRVLLLTGTVGAGKSTIAAEMNDLLVEQGSRPLRSTWTRWRGSDRPDSEWNASLTFENLAAVWPN
jgi:hypothetical protein